MPGDPGSSLFDLTSIDLQVDSLVVESDEALDLDRFGLWVFVAPRYVLACVPKGGSRKVNRPSLVCTLGHVSAYLEQIHSDVFLRNVVARRQARLEQRHGPIGLGELLSLERHAHVAGAWDDVDPRIGVTRMDEYLFVFFEPRVHAIEVEGDMTIQEQSALERVLVHPKCVLGTPVAGHDRAVRRVALEGAMGGMLTGFQELASHVLDRKVVHGQVTGLVEKLRIGAVDDRLAPEEAAYPLG